MLSCSLVSLHTANRARTQHTHTHTRTHTHTHTHTHTFPFLLSCASCEARVTSHMELFRPWFISSRLDPPPHTHTHIHTHTLARTHTRTSCSSCPYRGDQQRFLCHSMSGCTRFQTLRLCGEEQVCTSLRFFSECLTLCAVSGYTHTRARAHTNTQSLTLNHKLLSRLLSSPQTRLVRLTGRASSLSPVCVMVSLLSWPCLVERTITTHPMRHKARGSKRTPQSTRSCRPSRTVTLCFLGSTEARQAVP
jgi:hypothetical protein